MKFEQKYPNEPGFYWAKYVYYDKDNKPFLGELLVIQVRGSLQGHYSCSPSGGYNKGNLDIFDFAICQTPIQIPEFEN
jgi:hypothetical protein